MAESCHPIKTESRGLEYPVGGDKELREKRDFMNDLGITSLNLHPQLGFHVCVYGCVCLEVCVCVPVHASACVCACVRACRHVCVSRRNTYIHNTSPDSGLKGS